MPHIVIRISGTCAAGKTALISFIKEIFCHGIAMHNVWIKCLTCESTACLRHFLLHEACLHMGA